MSLADKLFGTYSERQIKKIKPLVDKIEAMAEKYAAMTDEELTAAHFDHSVRMPMLNDIRSLNLSNTVAIAVYETLRQGGFEGMKTDGEKLASMQ